MRRRFRETIFVCVVLAISLGLANGFSFRSLSTQFTQWGSCGRLQFGRSVTAGQIRTRIVLDLQAEVIESIIEEETVRTVSSEEERWVPCEPILLASLVDDEPTLDVDSASDLPPWLDRYDSCSPQQAAEEMAWLKYSLQQRSWSIDSVEAIMEQIDSFGDAAIVVRVIDFLRIYLECFIEAPEQSLFVTPSVLSATIQHYSECIAVRRRGFHDLVRQTILKQEPKRRLGCTEQPSLSGSNHADACSVTMAYKQDDLGRDTLEIQRIASSAARIKRAEILALVFLASADFSSWQTANGMRSLLLSVTDDFRALAIRCVACLYRLQGILQQQQDRGVDEYLVRTPEIIRTAKEGIRVYAPLAQRLGMQRLKARIEEAAFQILYMRQYRAVSSLYHEKGQAMESVSNYLASQMTTFLHQDKNIMALIENLEVRSRVKEPFSFWKKLLRKRSQSVGSEKHLRPSMFNSSTSLSLIEVNDAVAVRVILRARKWSEDEDDETTRARERLLCYYVQDLLREKWGGGRLKDYIHHPKSNGYQSLHHTSKIRSRGIEFPFEVQVRSEEMHQAAEYGMASHWVYKLGSESPSSTVGEVAEPSASFLLPSSHTEQDSSESSPPAEEETGIEAFCLLGTTGSYLDALVTAKNAMMKRNVYVFMAGDKETPEEGQLLSLPGDALIQDALLAVSGNTTMKVYRNGRVAGLQDSIENGDVLVINQQH